MAKFQNTFSRGVINKDLQGRFVDSAELIDAENYFVTTTQGSSVGVGKNSLGNVKRTNLNIPGGKTIGVGKNESKEKVYNLVKGTNHDYVIEYDEVTYACVVIAQSSTGSRLNFKTGERITNVDVIDSGEAYDPVTGTGGDLLAFSGDTNAPRVLNIERSKTWGIDGFTEEEISVMKSSPIFSPVITLTTSVEGVDNNFIETKFARIAYRYKYIDGFESVPSSWSKIAFEPKSFELDYQNYENKGMVNLSNAIDISFKTGPREVAEVELLFKESDSNDIYVIHNFNKQKEGWADNSTQLFQLSTSKLERILSAEESSRNFDNVPLSAVAQTTIMNRLAYANYKEGRNIDTLIDFEAECVSTNPYVGSIDTEIESFTDSVEYSNVVDFEVGIADGGSAPVDQMNFTTNELNVDLTGATSGALTIEVTPKSGYSAVPYTITVKDGATVVDTLANVTGNQTNEYSTTSNKNLKIYVTSAAGIIYDCKLIYVIHNFPTLISKWNYFATHQLSFPKSTGYGADLLGDVIIERESRIDLATYIFKSGQQIRINFELQSSLVLEVKPSVTFFYNLTSDYINVADFFANSSFKDQLENAFSLSFRTTQLSNEGSIVTYVGFLVSLSGTTIIINTPKVVYSVLEPSGITEDKNEFFLTNEAAFLTITENSFSSMHSNRDVEVCMFYMDAQGRKTTSLVSEKNTFHIPAEKSVMVNKIKVTLNHAPPSWAKYYKFGVKQTRRAYETIYGNEVYKDGIYRWIRLVGENKNKVKEGTILIVKSDYSGPLEYLAKAKVLEITMQPEDFIKENKIASGADLIEPPSLYMKIKQGLFNINIDQDSFQTFAGYGKRRYASESFVTTAPLFGTYEASLFKPFEVNAGSQIRFYVSFKAYGNIEFHRFFEVKLTAQKNYISIKEWWEAEVQDLNSWTVYATENISEWKFEADGSAFSVKCNRNGTASRDIMTDVVFDVNFAGGMLAFETEAFEDLSSPFFETPETFTISAGAHESTTHTLNDAYNCYAFGNGVESYKIEDSFLGKTFSIDSNPSEVSKGGYKQTIRFADITYSGVFNSNSNVNKLSEFNLALANFKDDIEKSYGPIYKIKGEDTNLQVYQEDKDSQVFYGKDILYNADGTTNLTLVDKVLGNQDTYLGNFGISAHPDSYDDYGHNAYHTDVKRGVVMKKSNNGLFEISSQGMRSYFKALFRDNTINHINGKYDQYNDFYVLNIQYNTTEYVTWVYSDKDNGWLGRMTFNPEDMIRINGKFLSFKNGEVYEHNSAGAYNTFYGVESPSTFTFNFSQNPSERKDYKTMEMESTDAWDMVMNTDLQNGFINKEDYVKQEGVFYAYIRTSNDTIDSSLLSCQGIGNCSVNALVLSFNFDLDDVISVGDAVRNADLELVGTILSKTARTLTLNTVNNIVTGDYVLCSKPQSIANNVMLGYHLEVHCSLSKTTKTEVYSVNAEVVKSFS